MEGNLLFKVKHIKILLAIIGSEKHGKIKMITLTEKGAKLADMLANAYSIVNGAEKEKEVQQQKAAEPAK
jgi:hypothetical protein